MMETISKAPFFSKSVLFRRHVALPQDHGAWVFILSPLLIGLFAGGSFGWPTLALIVASLAAFMLRQPVTILVKIRTGRRSTIDLSAAIFWLILYTIILFIALLILIISGYAGVLLLGIPATPVFAWHLYLVSKREERHNSGVEILGAGVLSLAAPAAYWVGLGHFDSLGWALWALCWLQSAASIVYAYLRLAQRALKEAPSRRNQWLMGLRAALYTTFNLTVTVAAAIGGLLPRLIWLPYLLQWAETIWGILHPAIGSKPTQIGLRQLAVSSIFTFLFIVTWRI